MDGVIAPRRQEFKSVPMSQRLSWSRAVGFLAAHLNGGCGGGFGFGLVGTIALTSSEEVIVFMAEANKVLFQPIVRFDDMGRKIG